MKILNTYELTPVYSNVQSYYRKAHVLIAEDGAKILKSYNTNVLIITPAGDVVRTWKEYTATTGRHIKEFLKQETGRTYTKKRN